MLKVSIVKLIILPEYSCTSNTFLKLKGQRFKTGGTQIKLSNFVLVWLLGLTYEEGDATLQNMPECERGKIVSKTHLKNYLILNNKRKMFTIFYL